MQYCQKNKKSQQEVEKLVIRNDSGAKDFQWVYFSLFQFFLPTIFFLINQLFSIWISMELSVNFFNIFLFFLIHFKHILILFSSDRIY